jgi:hypothetical protein
MGVQLLSPPCQILYTAPAVWAVSPRILFALQRAFGPSPTTQEWFSGCFGFFGFFLVLQVFVGFSVSKLCSIFFKMF